MKLGKREDRRFTLEKTRLPLVALIDVVLFLLIYFVMAGTLAAEESQLAASLKTDRASAAGGQDLQPLIVAVEPGADGPRFRLGERVLADQAALRALLEQLPRRDGVVVRVAGAVPIEAAAAALQAATDAGFERVSYVPGK